MSPANGLVLAAVSIVACGPSYKKLKVDKIQSVAVTVEDQQQRFCAYQPAPLRVVVTYRDGKQAQSRAPGEKSDGRLRRSEFQWSSNHGTIDSEAVLSLPGDPLAWFDEPIRVSALVIARPELVGETTLLPRFDCGGTVRLEGAEGARGGEAEHGGPGEAGPELHVALGYVQPKRGGRLVLVRVQNGSEEPEHFIVAPRGPRTRQLVIDARGGAGGRGGQGVMGHAGTAGIDGQDGAAGVECDGTPGQDGTEGEAGGPGDPGGNGGPGGRGGSVLVRYDARFPELPDQIQIRVEGGDGGLLGPGGPGGRGGKGGKGGKGGAGDPNTGPHGTNCKAPDGHHGADGAHGSPGPAGTAGVAGAPGEISSSAADVAELFAEEMKRGIPIVTDERAVPDDR